MAEAPDNAHLPEPASATGQARDNKSVFSREEFERWAVQEAEKARLDINEKFLVECFFRPSGRTLEGGTGGGRVLFGLQALGYHTLYGFDQVAQSIECARARDREGKIHFEVMDAVELRYSGDFFDQAIYPEQVLCFIEETPARRRAIQEVHRVVKPGGVALFTALAMEERLRLPKYRVFMAYLGLLRKLRGSVRSLQLSPWLKLGGKTHWGALLDAPPYVYWYTLREFTEELEKAGFRVEALATGRQIREQKLCATVEELAAAPLEGPLYVVCRK